MTWIDSRRSIRRTLLVLLLPAAVVLMAAAWLIHGLLLERMARDFVESRLQDEVAFLEHQLRDSEAQGIASIAAGDYFEEVFHHAFAIRRGEHTHISPAVWQPALTPLLSHKDSGFIRQRNGNADLPASDFLAYRKVTEINGEPVVILVAEDLSSLHVSQSELHIWTAVVSAGLLVLLVLVIWLAIRLSLRSVGRLQDALQKLQQGSQERLEVDAPSEFQPLVGQLNQLLDTLDQRLIRSREALANLSHSVKTPIAGVRQILEDKSRPLDAALREQMAQRLSDLDRQLEAEMRRSQFAGRQVGRPATPLRQARDLLWMLGRLYPDKSFELETDLPEERRWLIEEHDLNELMGNLLDNAGKWARRCAVLTLEEDREAIRITVTDDGPGVPPDTLAALGTRGLRLDQQTPGHGLGLAIVQDITERYGGRLGFSCGINGGLVVRVSVPLREPPSS
ncbi:MAG: sensor histidine kinase [Oleiphilaceae bacterium]|nr:sensor histidine kinase [Oleiphilaceae bacterium]